MTLLHIYFTLNHQLFNLRIASLQIRRKALIALISRNHQVPIPAQITSITSTTQPSPVVSHTMALKRKRSTPSISSSSASVFSSSPFSSRSYATTDTHTNPRTRTGHRDPGSSPSPLAFDYGSVGPLSVPDMNHDIAMGDGEGYPEMGPQPMQTDHGAMGVPSMTYETTPPYLHSRTRKRFRDGRPDERAVHGTWSSSLLLFL